MKIFETINNQIENLQEELYKLRSENDLLKNELENMKNQDSMLQERSEHIISNIDKALASIAKLDDKEKGDE
jgi:predicted  nucleic acid-binding Zn-ribbon protein